MTACPMKLDQEVLRAIGKARCRANSGALRMAANLMSAAEVGELVVQEYVIVTNALAAAAAAAAAADVADVAKTSNYGPGRPDGAEDAATVPAWAKGLIAALERYSDDFATFREEFAAFRDDQSVITDRTFARVQNSWIDSMSQDIKWFRYSAQKPIPAGAPTTTAALMALPGDKVAELLRIYGQRADSDWTDETFKQRMRKYLAIGDKLKADQ
jgi:hypothetical protein